MADWISSAGDWARGLDAAGWQAVGTIATAIIAVVAAWLALRQLKAHQAARVEQSRPYVIVDFSFRSVLMTVEVRNIGQTAAKSVKLTWDPRPQGVDDRRTSALQRNLVNADIPFLAPGRSIRYPVGRAPDYWNAPDVPKRYTVEAIYEDTRGQRFGAGERMVLDLAQWAEALADTDYDNKNWNEFKRQAEAQKRISDHLARIDDRAEGLLASFAQTAVHMLAALRLGRNDGVVWAVIPHSSEGRLVANVGCEVARDVEIAETGDGGESDFLQVEGDDLPRDVRVGDAVELVLFPTLGQRNSTQISVTWTEGGQKREAEYTVGFGR